jgi:hypothetical protein
MKKKNYFSMIIIFTALLSSCNMEKEIDLALPEYESKMIVECYLDPGNPYRLSLFESVSYFEEPSLPSIDSALVTISHNGIVDTLKFNPYLDIITNKFYNYVSDSLVLVPFDYTSEFFLEIRDRNGRVATSRAKIAPPVTIDTVEFVFNSDSMAYPLTQFTDNPNMTNYYRYLVIRYTYTGPEVQDFQFDDLLLTSSQVALGSNYTLEKSDFVIITLYHVEESYFAFLESAAAAVDANGNPFGQPSAIKSNITGGIGIFAGLSYDRKELTVK